MATQPTPHISLVVKTRNRGERLDPFFDAIRKLEYPRPWELIIADNGSTDDTQARLRAFAATFPGRLKILWEPRAGAGRACNAGWRAAEAPLIAFTDDDCYPAPTYLQNVEAVFADDPLLGFAGGRILLFDPTDAPVTILESNVSQTVAAGSFLCAGFITGANMTFRRQVLLEVDGFDNAFGPGTPFICEEADLILRALASGWHGKYDPRLVVHHHHRRKAGRDVELLCHAYDAGRGACYTKCLLFLPQRWKCALFWFRCIVRQPISKTGNELFAALRYGAHLLTNRPNTTYRKRMLRIMPASHAPTNS